MKIEDIIQKFKPPFDITKTSPADFNFLKEKLKKYNYNEEQIASKLSIPHLYCYRPETLPVDLKKRLAKGEPLDSLIKLFFLQHPLNKKLICEIFEDNEMDFLKKVGIIREKSEIFFSNIAIYPCLERLIASDPRFVSEDSPDEKISKVMYLGKDSYDLVYAVSGKKVLKTLDLCTGSGVHGIMASPYSEIVVSSDINFRALEFARLNSLINNTSNVSCCKSDLFAEINQGPFDLILINPPFVPSIKEEVLYRDGGPTGEEILFRLLKNLHMFLKKDGICIISTVMIIDGGKSYEEKLSDLVGEDLYNILVLTYSSVIPEFYFINHALMASNNNTNLYSDMLLGFEEVRVQKKIREIAHGLIFLQRTESEKKWKQVKCIKDPTPTLGRDISEYIENLNIIYNIDFLNCPDKFSITVSDKIENIWINEKKSDICIIEFNRGALEQSCRLCADELEVFNKIRGDKLDEVIMKPEILLKLVNKGVISVRAI